MKRLSSVLNKLKANSSEEFISHLLDEAISKYDRGFPPDSLYEENPPLYAISLMIAATTHAERKEGYIHPSSAYGDCSRKYYYMFNGEPASYAREKNKPSLQRIFDVGHYWHLYTQLHLKHIGVIIREEVDVHDEDLGVTGHADAEIKFRGQIGGLEIKSMNTFQFSKLKAPLDKHKFQANIYCGIMKWPFMVYLYINKDSGELKEFMVDFDAQEFDSFVYWVKNIHKACAVKKPPVRVCRDEHSDMAHNCPYRSICFNL